VSRSRQTGRIWHVGARRSGAIRAGITHFLAIPALAAPAHTIGVDDAGSSATAPHVIGHVSSFGLDVEKVNCVEFLRKNLRESLNIYSNKIFQQIIYTNSTQKQ
jgi:hypothetical protein